MFLFLEFQALYMLVLFSEEAMFDEVYLFVELECEGINQQNFPPYINIVNHKNQDEFLYELHIFVTF
jgi:hypothetical protein